MALGIVPPSPHCFRAVPPLRGGTSGPASVWVRAISLHGVGVVVVGGGFAGLAAARRLTAAGAEVTVLEARDRVGGRVWSRTLGNGEVVELGGEWIDASQATITGLVGELGLRLVDTGQDFITRDLIGGPPISDEDHAALAARVVAVNSDLGASADQVTIAAVLEMTGCDGPEMQVLRSRLAGTFGVPLDRVSAAELGEEFGMVQGSRYLRVEGGNDLIAAGMAGSLDVRLSSPVTRIEQGADSVVVHTTSRSFEAGAVVVAVPLPVLRRSGFMMGIPPELASALQDVGMGTAAKVAVATREEPPMFRRQEADIPGWYWTGARSDGTTRRAVTGFAGTATGVARLLADVESRLAGAAPEVVLEGSPTVVDWGADPWAGGCYSALGPGQRALLAGIQDPWGRVGFAGEHVNGSGTMAGAIESGFEVADLVLEAGFV